MVSCNKPQSVPRLELNGLVLANKMAKYLTPIFKLEDSNTFIHSDSMVVLFWLQHDLNKLRVYGHNRIKQSMQSKFYFKYVSSKQNAADYLTKNCATNNYRTHGIWLSEPSFLKTVECCRDQPNITQNPSTLSSGVSDPSVLDPSTIETIQS